MIARLRPLALLGPLLAFVVLAALASGYHGIDGEALRNDPTARTIFFQIRLPRVLLAVLVGASLSAAGASLQALFRNPLADPFVLGVSGGGALGATVAIALGLGARLGGTPLVFVSAFLGSVGAVLLVYRIAGSARAILPGALLLGGVIVNLIAAAAVLLVQYASDPSRALHILRWMMGNLELVGFDLLWRMLPFLLPGLAILLPAARDLHLVAVDEEAAPSLGVDLDRLERRIYLASALVVGVTVAVAGPIGFVGLVVPHAARLLFGEDVRVVLPSSMLLGAAFLVAADTVARTALAPAELPVGVVTALAGGPLFLWLLGRQRRLAAW